MYYYDNSNRQTNKLISNIEKAINGEYSAIHCYTKLAELAPSKGVRKQILEIRQDEVKHFQQFVQIYGSLTGTSARTKN